MPILQLTWIVVLGVGGRVGSEAQDVLAKVRKVMKVPVLTNSMAPRKASPTSRASGNCEVAPTRTTESCTSTLSLPQGWGADPSAEATALLAVDVVQVLGSLQSRLGTAGIVSVGRALRVHATGHELEIDTMLCRGGASSDTCMSDNEEVRSSIAAEVTKLMEVSGRGAVLCTLAVLLALRTVRSVAQQPYRPSVRSQAKVSAADAGGGDSAASVVVRRSDTNRSTSSASVASATHGGLELSESSLAAAAPRIRSPALMALGCIWAARAVRMCGLAMAEI